MGERICSIDGCGKPAKTRGWCHPHYMRWWQTGDVRADRPIFSRVQHRGNAAERFRQKIAIGPVSEHRPDLGPCWVWTAGLTQDGYGKLRAEGRSVVAHRFAYEQYVGPIPADRELDHLCRVRACVNPAHLEPVTDRENMLRGEAPSAINARKTHCIRGHEFTPENTCIRPDGRRRCRTCAREEIRERRAALRAAA